MYLELNYVYIQFEVDHLMIFFMEDAVAHLVMSMQWSSMQQKKLW